MARDQQSETPGSGHNNRELVRNYVQRIERLYDEIEVFRQEFVEAAKPIREEIATTLAEAGDHGLDKKVLRSVLRARSLEARADGVRTKLDPYGQQTFDQMRQALGDLASLPLGKAALDKVEVRA